MTHCVAVVEEQGKPGVSWRGIVLIIQLRFHMIENGARWVAGWRVRISAAGYSDQDQRGRSSRR